MRWPCFERWIVRRYSGEVRIVKKLEHLFILFQTDIPLPIFWSEYWGSEMVSGSLLVGNRAGMFHETGSNQENVADLDVTPILLLA